MNTNNGVIRIGRKGVKKFVFGEDGKPFEVDVVVAFQQWICIDEEFRPVEVTAEGTRPIPIDKMPDYHQAAILFVSHLSGSVDITTAEALDFIARLREQYDELAVFFRPRSLEERVSPGTLEVGSELRFSEEDSATSKN